MTYQPADTTEVRTDIAYSYPIDQNRAVLLLDVMAGQAVMLLGDEASSDLTFVPYLVEPEEFSLRSVPVSDDEILAWGDALPTYAGPDDMVDLDI